jgi:MFS family permease
VTPGRVERVTGTVTVAAAAPVPAAVASPFGLLRQRDFATFWFANVASDVGTWMQSAVVGALVARSTGRAWATALVTTALFFPQLIAAPLGGLLADRRERRTTFMATLSAQTIVTVVLAIVIASGERRTLVLSGIVLVQGFVGALGTPASASLGYDLAGPRNVMAMSSLGAFSWNSGRVLGPPLGIVLDQIFGPQTVVSVNAVSFALLVIALAQVHRSFHPPTRAATTPMHDLRAGLSSFFGHPTSRFVVLRLLPFQFLLMGFMTMFPIKVRDLGAGRNAIGLLSGTQGIGAVIGSILVMKTATHFGRRRTLMVLLMLGSIGVAGYAVSNTVPLAMLCVASVGTCISGSYVLFMATLQRDVPNDLRGRVMAMNQAFLGGTFTVGSVVLGGLSDLTTLTTALAAAALLHLAVVAGSVLWHRDRWRIVDRTTPTPPSAPGPAAQSAAAVT